MNTGRRCLMVAPLFLTKRIFPRSRFILDADTWRATLHIEVFLPAQVPDSELDSWMESRIYPAMSAIPALAGMITTMVQQGYDYRRDDDMALWSSADLTYSITYEM